MRPVLPVFDYAVNYAYISKVLCANKAKPAMHCNGKCHLMKELAKAAENEKPSSPDRKNAPLENDFLFFEPLKSINLNIICFDDQSDINSVYSNLYTAPDS